jgi:hypothetical protein
MVSKFSSGRDERNRRLENAFDKFLAQEGHLEELKAKLTRSRITYLVAGLPGGLTGHYPLPALPADFDVLGADGSHLALDRHRSPPCFLVNIGTVALHYGAVPSASLTSHPRLYFTEEDLVLREPGQEGRRQVIDGGLLGIKRAVEECRGLAELAAGVTAGKVLAMLDGTLILWGLEAYPEFVSYLLIEKGLLAAFESMRHLNRDRRLALASYISLPGATEVANVLRVALCPQGNPDCDHCPASDNRPCDAVAGIADRELFGRLLGDGERSELFYSQSAVVGKYYGAHRVNFFYLSVGEEIARVEVPAWVAGDSALLDMVHATVLDQCRRGHGYPVALSEAHEQAVVTGADRDNFWQLVESKLASECLPDCRSVKSQRKKTRWL